MDMKRYIILQCLILVLLNAQSYGGIYSFSWLAGFCYDEAQNKRQTCEASKIALWDSQSFTIHGLWPDLVSPSSFGAFNSSLLQKQIKLLDNMQNYWPPKSKASSTNVFLWQHEWDVHGKDYAAILFKLKPQNFPGTIDARNQALQIAFYKDVISFYQKFKVKKLPKGILTKTEMSHILGIAQNEFIFVCSNTNIVKQLQICFDITKSGMSPKACSKVSNCSGQNIQLLNFKITGQSRVTNYPASSILSED